jgi:hypothetical protein
VTTTHGRPPPRPERQDKGSGGYKAGEYRGATRLIGGGPRGVHCVINPAFGVLLRNTRPL